MRIFLVKVMKSLGSLLPFLGALHLVKFTLNDQLAAHGLQIPIWVTQATAVAFTVVFLMALTAILLGRRQKEPLVPPVSATVRRRSRHAATAPAPENTNQTRHRKRLNALSRYV